MCCAVQSTERLVRKFMSFPHHPAIAFLNVLTLSMTCANNNPYAHVQNCQGAGTFWGTVEDNFQVVAVYYGQTSLSARNAAWLHAAYPGAQQGYHFEDLVGVTEV
jgi:hypothetical protein